MISYSTFGTGIISKEIGLALKAVIASSAFSLRENKDWYFFSPSAAATWAILSVSYLDLVGWHFDNSEIADWVVIWLWHKRKPATETPRLSTFFCACSKILCIFRTAFVRQEIQRRRNLKFHPRSKLLNWRGSSYKSRKTGTKWPETKTEAKQAGMVGVFFDFRFVSRNKADSGRS